MSVLRFEVIVDGYRLVGPIRGSGGMVGSVARVEAAQRLARQGRPHGLYEPLPGHVAVYPDYCAVGDGKPCTISLVSATIRPVDEVRS